MKYALVRGKVSGLIHIFLNWHHFTESVKEMWEVLAESDDEQTLQAMVKLTEETT